MVYYYLLTSGKLLSCLSALKCRHLLAHGGQSHINSSSGSDRLAGRFVFLKTPMLPVQIPLPCPCHTGARGQPPSPDCPADAVGSHLSMLIAQRFKMLAVHIITSMVTKISQQMRLKVQTPPVTCTSNHKTVSLVPHRVLISYV